MTTQKGKSHQPVCVTAAAAGPLFEHSQLPAATFARTLEIELSQLPRAGTVRHGEDSYVQPPPVPVGLKGTEPAISTVG